MKRRAQITEFYTFLGVIPYYLYGFGSELNQPQSAKVVGLFLVARDAGIIGYPALRIIYEPTSMSETPQPRHNPPTQPPLSPTLWHGCGVSAIEHSLSLRSLVCEATSWREFVADVMITGAVAVARYAPSVCLSFVDPPPQIEA